MKTLLLIFAVFATMNTTFANDSILNGKITNDEGQTLERAWVVVLDTNDMTYVTGTVTDENGYFEINTLGEGDYVISVDHPDFDTPRIIKELNTLEFEGTVQNSMFDR